MAALHRTLGDFPKTDETVCLHFYGMLSLHEVFEVVGSQLTETDVETLSFLLDETCPAPHPLDPAGWTVEPRLVDPADSGTPPDPELLKAWRRLKPKSSQGPLVASDKPKIGVQLLLELERRGYLSDGNLEPLLQLLRVLTRHDLLPLVSHKKRRTVSPERIGQRCTVENRESVCSSGIQHSCRQTGLPFRSFEQQLRTGIYPPMSVPSATRKKKRGNGWSRRPKRTSSKFQSLPFLPPTPPRHKVSSHIRMRVRADYLEHESALRGGVSSDKPQPLERQFELFSQANALLRGRDLGSVVCDIKFTDLDNLEAFWADYLSGDLLEALKGVFITDALRTAAGSEGVRLLISVDQDDYELGRRRLAARRTLYNSHGGHYTETRWTRLPGLGLTRR